MSASHSLPVFHLGMVVGQFGGLRDLVKRDQHQIGRHHATVKPVDFPTTLDAAHHPDFVANHFGFDFGDKEFLQPERVGRPSNTHFRTPPAFLEDAFARHSTSVAYPTFVGDLLAASKRKSGNSLPYNHVAAGCSRHWNTSSDAQCTGA